MRAESAHAALLIAVVGGLGLSVFAAVESLVPYFRSACSFNAFFSCSKVDSSAFTTTLGVQDYSIGIAGFVVLLALDIPLFRSWRRDLLKAVVLVSALGLAVAAYFAYVELTLIQAFCLVCFSTYLADAAVLALSLWLLRSGADGTAEDTEESAEPTADTDTTASS